jgi:hypothetical protein
VDSALKVGNHLIATVDFLDHFANPRMSGGELPLQFRQPLLVRHSPLTLCSLCRYPWMVGSGKFGQQLSGQMFVVAWEPKRGAGGGHQAVMDQDKAEQVSRTLMRARPDDTIRVMSAWEYGAAAVVERQQRRAMRQ